MSYNCVVCNYPRTKVQDSRAYTFRGRTIVCRRRVCLKCGFRENSFEVPQADFEELKESTKELHAVYASIGEQGMRALKKFLDAGIKKTSRDRNAKYKGYPK